MELVDTHCHIQSIGSGVGDTSTRKLWAQAPELTSDQVVAAAAEMGVTRLVCVGCDPADSRLAVDFVQEREGCWAAVGIHPHEAKYFAGQTDKLDVFAALASRPKVVAVGECGLDFYYNNSPRAAQLAVLKFQLSLAVQRDLPAIFHVRQAFDDFWPVFDSYSGLRGVLHSYTDSPVNLAKALERGLYIGLNGIATFTKDEAQLEVYKSVPLENLLLETDAPYLTPEPFRGNINEPKRLRAVAEFMSKLRGESLEDLASATTANARRLFGI